MQTYKLTHPNSSHSHRFGPQLMHWIQNSTRQLWQRVKPTQAIQVWSSQDPQGNTYWNGYDPRTNRQILVTSQEELIDWIEQAEPMSQLRSGQPVEKPFLYPLSNRFSPHL